MKLIEREGDLFTTTARAIGHGVNTHGLMGAGIAKSFREKFPTMYEEYRIMCSMGTLTPGQHYHYQDKRSGLHVFNIASQDAPGANARYDWLIMGVMRATMRCEELGVERLALPYIGAGIGGLDPAKVKMWLTELAEAGPTDIELWTYVPPKGA